MAEITREDLLLIAEIQGKVATQMESVANSVRAMAENNKEIATIVRDMPSMYSKSREICLRNMTECVEERVNGVKTVPNENKIILQKVRDDVFWMKIIIGSVGLITTLVVVLTQISVWLSTFPVK